MDNVAQERINTVVRNILSGNNNCSTLAKACSSGNGQYFYNAVSPAIAVYASELADMTKQRDNLSVDCEAKRFALESIMSNIDAKELAPSVADAIRKAMPGRHW